MKELKKERTVKSVCIKFPEEIHTLMVLNAKKRSLDYTNYIRYLIQNDKDDKQSNLAANAINGISEAITVMERECKNCGICESYIKQMKEGVKDLWRCLH